MRNVRAESEKPFLARIRVLMGTYLLLVGGIAVCAVFSFTSPDKKNNVDEKQSDADLFKEIGVVCCANIYAVNCRKIAEYVFTSADFYSIIFDIRR